MMKMFTDPRTPANVKSVSDSITMTWLLPHASEDLAQCDDHCSHSFSIKQGKVKACVEFSFTYYVEFHGRSRRIFLEV